MSTNAIHVSAVVVQDQGKTGRDIQRICGKNWSVPSGTAICQLMDNKIDKTQPHIYYTKSGGAVAWVKAAKNKNATGNNASRDWHLTTSADETKDNNLLSLPVCDGKHHQH